MLLFNLNSKHSLKICVFLFLSPLPFSFAATWTPSAQPREAPERTFINGPGGEECIAPWAQAGSAAAPPGSGGSGGGAGGAGGAVLPPTRAPWAK